MEDMQKKTPDARATVGAGSVPSLGNFLFESEQSCVSLVRGVGNVPLGLNRHIAATGVV